MISLKWVIAVAVVKQLKQQVFLRKVCVCVYVWVPVFVRRFKVAGREDVEGQDVGVDDGLVSFRCVTDSTWREKRSVI